MEEIERQAARMYSRSELREALKRGFIAGVNATAPRASSVIWEDSPTRLAFDSESDEIRLSAKSPSGAVAPAPPRPDLLREFDALAMFEREPYCSPNWDSYDGCPVDRRAIEAARTFLRYAWDVVPCSDGGLQVERHHSGIDLEVDFAADGTVENGSLEILQQGAPAPPSEPEPRQETAWLIGRVGPEWWTGRANTWTGTVDGTNYNPTDSAIRFARREDAERAIGWLIPKELREFCKAEEHIWG